MNLQNLTLTIYPGWRRLWPPAGLIFLFVAALSLAGCRPESGATLAAGLPTAEPAATVAPAPQETPLAPPVVITPGPGAPLPPTAAPTHEPPPVIAGESAAEAAEEAVEESVETAAQPAAQQAAAAVPEHALAEAPDPTYTPPPSPGDSPWDHFWLNRPVPQDSVVWTDKHYPYGGTRGGTLRTHHGVEFMVPANTEILSAASGAVIFAGDDSQILHGPIPNFYGKLVVIQHDFTFEGQPVYTLYAHLAHLLVQEGQRVEARQTIAISGATGVADGPHLHFEVRVGENSYDATRNPLLWLYPFPDRGVVAGRVVWPDGSLAYEVPLRLRRLDAPSAYAATTSYADDRVQGDDNWGENFAFDDVYAGYYELTIQAGDQRYREEFWVYPYRTTFVEIVLDP